MSIYKLPLTWISIFVVVGILLGFYFKPSPELSIFILGIIFFIFIFSFANARRKRYFLIFFGLSACMLAASIGTFCSVVHNDSLNVTHYTRNSSAFEKAVLVYATVREKLKTNSFGVRYLVILKQIDSSEQSGELILNLSKDNLKHNLAVGSNILFKSRLVRSSFTKNPFQFDYGQYLENKQVYAQVYIQYSDMIMSDKVDKDIWYFAANLRDKIVFNLQKVGFAKDELSVATALILGQQYEISPEIIKDYQFAGAVHILSVSGLHVGFVVFFVSLVLKPISNSKRWRFVKLIVTLFCLVCFGLIASWSPSVVRSVVMFSFVAIGMYMNRITNIYHTILVSMLVILLFKPSFLFDVGFQLSYVALFFIVWLQPLLENVWAPNNRVIFYFWQILTVSFAAQLGTLPLSIYYFHQFPGLFFVTNLIVIPFITVIMALGVIVMIMAAFNSTPVFLVKWFELCIWFLNKIINSIASVEQFIFTDIPLNLQVLVCLYLMIVSLVLWLKERSYFNLAFLSFCIIGLQLAIIYSKWEEQGANELIIFNARNSTLITERNGGKLTVFASDSLSRNLTKNMTLKSYSVGTSSIVSDLKPVNNMLYFQGQRVLVLDSTGAYLPNVSPDVVVLTESPKINFDRFIRDLKPKIVVADASNFRSYQNLWKASCAKAKIPFHGTVEKGFFKLSKR